MVKLIERLTEALVFWLLAFCCSLVLILPYVAAVTLIK